MEGRPAPRLAGHPGPAVEGPHPAAVPVRPPPGRPRRAATRGRPPSRSTRSRGRRTRWRRARPPREVGRPLAGERHALLALLHPVGERVGLAGIEAARGFVDLAPLGHRPLAGGAPAPRGSPGGSPRLRRPRPAPLRTPSRSGRRRGSAQPRGRRASRSRTRGPGGRGGGGRGSPTRGGGRPARGARPRGSGSRACSGVEAQQAPAFELELHPAAAVRPDAVPGRNGRLGTASSAVASAARWMVTPSSTCRTRPCRKDSAPARAGRPAARIVNVSRRRHPRTPSRKVDCKPSEQCPCRVAERRKSLTRNSIRPIGGEPDLSCADGRLLWMGRAGARGVTRCP